MEEYNGYVNMGFGGEFGTFYYHTATGEVSEERDYKYLVKPSVDSSIMLVEGMLKRYHSGLCVITGKPRECKKAA